jgi:hypothetical protein|nr:MAG TPA: hypothetical protein [Caudoviricetes sp.]
MSTILGVSNAVRMLKNNFMPEVTNSLRESEDLIHNLITDQLMAGLDENGKQIRPTYLQDPYFRETTKTEKAARKKAIWWRDMKERVTPPERSDILKFPPRNRNTPNLIITGEYHRSITPIFIDGKDGGKIVTRSIGFYAGDDALEKKYGSEHLGLTKKAKQYLLDNRVIPTIENLLKKYGFK